MSESSDQQLLESVVPFLLGKNQGNQSYRQVNLGIVTSGDLYLPVNHLLQEGIQPKAMEASSERHHAQHSCHTGIPRRVINYHDLESSNIEHCSNDSITCRSLTVIQSVIDQSYALATVEERFEG